ncbi:YjfB family protein [Aminipila sp.]|uniref:YjfB family protein n=1 Tax=Aminipila sp. TaxID=2060095 RepID=UPI001D1ADE53|nr:YjfB family protein [Aminipila sp.]MBE6035484.1 putative motility protein [Clostridiales bacterium]
MDGILSAYMGRQAQALQQSVSISVLNMAMSTQEQVMGEMIAELPDIAQSVPAAAGELGFNLDVYA